MRSWKSWLPVSVVAAALLAMALPAVSNAATLKNANGELVPVGSELILHSSNTQIRGLYGWECRELTANVMVVRNNGSIVELTGANNLPLQAGCFIGGTWRPFSVRNTAIDAEFIGPENGTAEVWYAVEGYPYPCNWNGTVEVTYGAGSDLIEVNTGLSYPLEAQAYCGEAGLHLTASLTRWNGEPLTLQ